MKTVSTIAISRSVGIPSDSSGISTVEAQAEIELSEAICPSGAPLPKVSGFLDSRLVTEQLKLRAEFPYAGQQAHRQAKPDGATKHLGIAQRLKQATEAVRIRDVDRFSVARGCRQQNKGLAHRK